MSAVVALWGRRMSMKRAEMLMVVAVWWWCGGCGRGRVCGAGCDERVWRAVVLVALCSRCGRGSRGSSGPRLLLWPLEGTGSRQDERVAPWLEQLRTRKEDASSRLPEPRYFRARKYRVARCARAREGLTRAAQTPVQERTRWRCAPR